MTMKKFPKLWSHADFIKDKYNKYTLKYKRVEAVKVTSWFNSAHLNMFEAVGFIYIPGKLGFVSFITVLK